jgi:hypothetical protein
MYLSRILAQELYEKTVLIWFVLFEKRKKWERYDEGVFD